MEERLFLKEKTQGLEPQIFAVWIAHATPHGLLGFFLREIGPS
jgi:hypothetical protein